MPENRGVEEAGKKEPEKGTTIVGNQIKGVKIIDKNTKVEPPPVVIGEGDNDS
jgi:hypothetical protein